jgi:hypothetical protein
MSKFLNSVKQFLTPENGRRRKSTHAPRTSASVRSFAPHVEELQPRLTPACTAQFGQGY